MKNLLVLLIMLALVSYGCQHKEESSDIADGVKKLQYLIKLKEDNGYRADVEKELLNNRDALLSFSQLSYRTLDSVLLQIIAFEKENDKVKKDNEFWKEFEKNGQLDEYKVRLSNAKSEDDIRKIISDFPLISEKSGLEELLKKEK